MKSTVFWVVALQFSRSEPRFWRNISPPSSGSISKPSKKLARARQQADQTLPQVNKWCKKGGYIFQKIKRRFCVFNSSDSLQSFVKYMQQGYKLHLGQFLTQSCP
jgi:hypothetical protein